MAAHIRAVTRRLPNHGWPVKSLPAARISPWAGKYIDIYVGFMVTGMLSRLIHITGVGLVSLPDAKVSAARRKLKSSGRYGSGTGQSGRRASRRKNAVNPTT